METLPDGLDHPLTENEYRLKAGGEVSLSEELSSCHHAGEVFDSREDCGGEECVCRPRQVVAREMSRIITMEMAVSDDASMPPPPPCLCLLFADTDPLADNCRLVLAVMHFSRVFAVLSCSFYVISLFIEIKTT